MAEEVKIDITIDDGQSINTLADLREHVKGLRQEIENVELGSKEFEKLNRELDDANREVRTLMKGFDGIDDIDAKGLAGAIGDITGALILLGGESDTVDEVAVKIQTAVGVSMAFKGAIEGASTVFKIFNTVLKSNPIFLIVSALAALTAAVIYFTSATDENTESVKENIAALGEQEGWYERADKRLATSHQKKIALLKEENATQLDLLKAEKEYVSEQQEAAIARLSIAEKEYEELKKIRVKDDEDLEAKIKKQDELIDSIQNYKLQLDGLEVDAINASSAIRDEQDKIAENEIKKLDERISKYKEYAANRLNAQRMLQDLELGLLEDGLEKELATINLNYDRIIEDIKANENLTASERTKLVELNNQERIQQLEAIEDREQQLAIEASQERLRIWQQEEDEYNARVLDAETKLGQLRRDANADQFQLQINQIRDQYEQMIEVLDENIPAENELKLYYEQELQDKILEIREQALQEDERLTEQHEQELANLRQERVDSVVSAANDVASITESLNTLIHSKEIGRIKDKISAGEQLTKAEQERLVKQEKMEKAAALAQVAVDTATAISGIVAASTAGDPYSYAARVAAGVAAVLAGVANAYTILNSSTPSIDTASVAERNTEDSTIQNDPAFDPFEYGSFLLNQDNRVYVVESDITDTQNRVSVIEAEATFG